MKGVKYRGQQHVGVKQDDLIVPSGLTVTPSTEGKELEDVLSPFCLLLI